MKIKDRSAKLDKRKRQMPKHGNGLKNVDIFDLNPIMKKIRKNEKQKRNNRKTKRVGVEW